MAVVVVTETPGGNADFYDQVAAKVAPGDKFPDGMQTHIAGPIEGGFRVITVWDSEETFHRFREEKLIPAFQEASAGGEAPAPPSIDIQQVHRFINSQ